MRPVNTPARKPVSRPVLRCPVIFGRARAWPDDSCTACKGRLIQHHGCCNRHWPWPTLSFDLASRATKWAKTTDEAQWLLELWCWRRSLHKTWEICWSRRQCRASWSPLFGLMHVIALHYRMCINWRIMLLNWSMRWCSHMNFKL